MPDTELFAQGPRRRVHEGIEGDTGGVRDAVHHVEVADDSGGVDQGGVAETGGEVPAGLGQLFRIPSHGGGGEGAERAPPLDAAVHGGVGEGARVVTTSAVLAAPPEQPGVCRRSVEALVDGGDPAGHPFDLGSVDGPAGVGAGVAHFRDG